MCVSFNNSGYSKQPAHMLEAHVTASEDKWAHPFHVQALRSRSHLSPHISLHGYRGVMSKTHFTPPAEARGRMLERQSRTYEGTWGRGAMTSEGGLGVSRSLSRLPNWESVNGGGGEWVMWRVMRRVRCVQLCISSFLPKLARRHRSVYKSGSKKKTKNTDTVLDELSWTQLVLLPQTFLCVIGEHESKGSVWMWKEKEKTCLCSSMTAF